MHSSSETRNPTPFPTYGLALVGMAGSGKSTAVSYLAAICNAPTIYLGGAVMEIVQQRGLEPGEASERSVREELRRDHGMAAAAVVAQRNIVDKASKAGVLIIDGLYSWAEYEFLSEIPGLHIQTIAIHADRFIREQRMVSREVRPLQPNDLRERDLREVMNLDKATPIALADFHVLNNGTAKDLEQQLDRVLSRALPRNDRK